MPLLYWSGDWMVKLFCSDRASLNLEIIQIIKNISLLWKFSDTFWGLGEEVELEGEEMEWLSLEGVAGWKLSVIRQVAEEERYLVGDTEVLQISRWILKAAL